MTAKITSVTATEMMAERGTLGLRVTVTTDTGAVGVSTPSGGVSTGIYEAAFVLDGEARFKGKGQRQAAKNINEIIGPRLVGMEVSRQREIDQLMCELDGTDNKRKLGANAMVGVSLAVVKAAANASGLPLYQYIGGSNACVMPMPIFGICLCGRYRDAGKTRWLKPSYEIIPYGATGFENSVEMAYEFREAFTEIIVDRYGINAYRQTSLEHAYDSYQIQGLVQDDREILDAMTEALVRTGQEDKTCYYYDAAGGCYYEEDVDKYVGIYSEGEKSREEMMAYYKEIVANHPILSIEDPFDERDWESHAMATAELGIEIVGDDLFTTNIERLRTGVAKGAGNSMVLKITQVGTVTEAMDAAKFCHNHGMNVHPCGSRGDRDSIADFALGLSAGQVRAFNYPRMRDLETMLGDTAVWPGKDLFKTGPAF